MLALIHTYFNWWIYIIQLGMFAIFHSFLTILKCSKNSHCFKKSRKVVSNQKSRKWPTLVQMIFYRPKQNVYSNDEGQVYNVFRKLIVGPNCKA